MDIQFTSDGSVTLYRPDIDEHYHSVKGALEESRRVYLELGWEHWAASHSSVRVFEVGFGTGLNAALTALWAEKLKIPTIYFSVELYPLDNQLSQKLAEYQSEEYAPLFRKVNEAQWNQRIELSPWFSLHKITADLLSLHLPEDIEVVYFDAFAPEKQPEMWEEDVFRKIFNSLTAGGVLTTYCAKGVIRRRLQEIGFSVERLDGPKGGKREVIRATKNL